LEAAEDVAGGGDEVGELVTTVETPTSMGADVGEVVCLVVGATEDFVVVVVEGERKSNTPASRST
jgi:hypothetical protein